MLSSSVSLIKDELLAVRQAWADTGLPYQKRLRKACSQDLANCRVCPSVRIFFLNPTTREAVGDVSVHENPRQLSAAT